MADAALRIGRAIALLPGALLYVLLWSDDMEAEYQADRRG